MIRVIGNPYRKPCDMSHIRIDLVQRGRLWRVFSAFIKIRDGCIQQFLCGEEGLFTAGRLTTPKLAPCP